MKPRKKKSPRSECGLSGAEAQAAYEQALGAAQESKPRVQNLAEHIAGCDPCSSALHVLELQGDAVGALAGQTRGEAAGTAVESILRIAARSGTGKLADLAYELAKACLIRLPNLERRVRRVVEPREARIVASELRATTKRRGPGEAPVSLTGVPAEAPAEADALRAATSCLKILQNIEGESPRQVLGMSQVHLFEERPEKAEKLLRVLLETPLDAQSRLFAEINLMLSLIRQANYSGAVGIGDAVLVRGDENWEVLFNLAVAHAHLRQLGQFKEVARQMRRAVPVNESSNLSRMMRFESPNFASDLGIEAAEVERALGLPRSTRSR